MVHMKKREIYLVFFLCISVLIFVFTISPFNFLANLINPLRANLYSLSHAQSKDSSYQKLENEIKKLREQLLEVEGIKKDNIALRSQFQETFIQPQRLLPSKVVGFKGKYTLPTSLLIDQGEKSGVKKNAAVIIGKELIGKIGTVSDYNSEVILINSPKFSTLAYDEKTNAPGILSGAEDFLLLDHVVITDEIHRNDKLLTKGEVFENGAIIPEGLFIGNIREVQKSETKPFQTGIVTTSHNATKLLTVFVVTEE